VIIQSPSKCLTLCIDAERVMIAAEDIDRRPVTYRLYLFLVIFLVFVIWDCSAYFTALMITPAENFSLGR